jgi:hypothetical protein
MRGTVIALTAVLMIAGPGCGSAPTSSSVPSSPPTSSRSPTPGAVATPTHTPSTPAPDWATDLALLDAKVRANHPNPFVNHSEAEWKAKLVQLAESLPATQSEDEQFVQLGSLIALLDTHSGIESAQQSRAYLVLVYRFPEGWYVVSALDQSLIGTRLLSINGTPVEDIEAQFRHLVAHDNESGALDAMQGLFSYVEWLHGSGIVTDVGRPAYVFESADGTEVRPEMRSYDTPTWASQLGILGGLVGDAPEAVARRGERVWTRLDSARRTFLVSVNDYGDMTAATAAMTKAVNEGKADRVVFDMRYLRGGSGDIQILDALKANPRINRPDGLTVLIGRENVSAATDVAHWLDAYTEATLVGEETPARADGYRCECLEIRLPFSRHLVVIPTQVDHNGDERSSIPPDVPMPLTAEDFFAGRDPVLDAALANAMPAQAPTP